jgi:hypothetical protein
LILQNDWLTSSMVVLASVWKTIFAANTCMLPSSTKQPVGKLGCNSLLSSWKVSDSLFQLCIYIYMFNFLNLAEPLTWEYAFF